MAETSRVRDHIPYIHSTNLIIQEPNGFYLGRSLIHIDRRLHLPNCCCCIFVSISFAFPSNQRPLHGRIASTTPSASTPAVTNVWDHLIRQIPLLSSTAIYPQGSSIWLIITTPRNRKTPTPPPSPSTHPLLLHMSHAPQ